MVGTTVVFDLLTDWLPPLLTYLLSSAFFPPFLSCSLPYSLTYFLTFLFPHLLLHPPCFALLCSPIRSILELNPCSVSCYIMLYVGRTNLCLSLSLSLSELPRKGWCRGKGRGEDIDSVCRIVRYDTVPCVAMPCYAMPCYAMPCYLRHFYSYQLYFSFSLPLY
jgi:hypothetical protein